MVVFSQDGNKFATGGADSNVIVWTSNLIDPEQEEEVSKVRNQHKASRRAMLGEDDVKPKKTFGSKRYFDKKQKEESAAAAEGKENISSNIAPSQPHADLPENLAGTLDKIVSQLDMIT